MSFNFKQFTIDDSHCAQKVGTDGVLIGAWTDVSALVNNVKNAIDHQLQILDVGAGCGLVSLMLAQRTVSSNARITAVEIDPSAAADCKGNFERSPWTDRLEVVNCDFGSVEGFFDVIISNPPFFQGDLESKTRARTLARQGETLSYFSLIDFASRHLKEGGVLAFTSDMRHQNDIIFTAEINKLYIKRLCLVSGKTGHKPIRALWEFERKRNNEMVKETLAHRNEDGSYHSDYIALTKDFYLNL